MVREIEFTFNRQKVHLQLDDPEEHEVVAHLKKIATMAEKREKIGAVMAQVDRVKAMLQKSPTNGNTYLQKLSETLPRTQAALRNSNNCNAQNLAQIYYNLNDIIQSFDEEEIRLSRADEEVLKYFDPFKAAFLIAENNAWKEKEKATQSYFLSANQYDRKRGYLKDGGFLPCDPAHRKCCICNHYSVDHPAINKQIEKDNFQEQLSWQATERDYNIRKQQNTLGPREKLGPRPKGKALATLCHCIKMKCCRGGGNNTCPHCPTGPQGNNPSGQCECEYCKCKCQAAYDLRMCHEIRPTRMNSTLRETIEHQALVEQQNSAMVITRMINDAQSDSLHKHVQHSLITGLPVNMDHVREDGLEISAKRTAKEFTSSSAHRSYLKNVIRGQFGPPTTHVAGIYEGDTLDARLSVKAHNKRKLNNLDSDVANGHVENQQERLQVLEDQQLAEGIQASLNSSSAPRQQFGCYPYEITSVAPNQPKPASRRSHNIPSTVIGGRTSAFSSAHRSPLPSQSTSTFASLPRRQGQQADTAIEILCDSSPEDLGDPLLPRRRTTKEFFMDVLEVGAASSRGTPILIDGATLSPEEKKKQSMNTTLFNFLCGQPVKGVPPGNQDGFLKALATWRRISPEMTPEQGFESFKELFFLDLGYGQD